MAEATIRDVASRAEVSVASVSRALNGIGYIRPQTRDRIMAAVAELGYVPHAGARSLSLARAHAIGVVLPDLHGEFFSECVRGMDREANRRGYMLLLSNMHDDGEQTALAMRAMRGRVDGLVVMAPHIEHDALARTLPAAIPSVLMNCPGDFEAHTTIRLDNRVSAAAMVDHLVANGYRHIVHVAGPEGNVDARERAEGFRDAMLRHGREPRIIVGDFNEETGEAAAAEILAGTAPCDAVFAANDMMALGCLHALRTAGKRVPEDIAVAGFDDVPMARYLALTTMRVRLAELGERAVALLVERIENKPPHLAKEVLIPELVARATTMPRAARPGTA